MHQVASLAAAGLVLLAPVGGGPAGGGEVALEVDGDDGVPLVLGHVDDHPVAQDAGVVDEDVEVAERLDRRVDQPLGALPVGDVVAVDDRLAAQVALISATTCWAGVASPPVAVVGAAEVVDDDLGALRGEQQRVLAADAASRSGDDRDATVE